MNGLSSDMFESYMNSLKYAEVVIKYKGQRYHIEAGTKKYTIGLFKRKNMKLITSLTSKAIHMMMLTVNL